MFKRLSLEGRKIPPAASVAPVPLGWPFSLPCQLLSPVDTQLKKGEAVLGLALSLRVNLTRSVSVWEGPPGYLPTSTHCANRPLERAYLIDSVLYWYVEKHLFMY